MNPRQIAILIGAILLPAISLAANPFLSASDDKPMSAMFRGSEWGDEIQQGEIPLIARVITTRLASMPWGGIFKIEFTGLESKASQKREIRPDYFLVTDDRIVLLNEENNEAAVKKISALEKAPEFEPSDIYGITTGKFNHEDGLWKTSITVKGDLCIYDSSHPSGHFKKIVWKKSVGLIEYGTGSGAHADGFRLKRQR